MVDMGSISFYLNLKVQCNREKWIIKLFQLAYIDKDFNKFHFNKAHTVNTPMKVISLLKQRTDGEASASGKEWYQGITGSLMFFIVEIRPDIVFAISITSCFVKNLEHQYNKAVKTILRYLKSSKEQGIIYSGQNKLLVEEYSNLDWARDKESRKSTSGFIFILNGRPVN